MTLKRTSWMAMAGTLLLLQSLLIWQLWRVQSLAPIRESGVLMIATLMLILTLLLCVWEQWLHRRLTREVRLTGDQLRIAMKSGHAVAWNWDLKSGWDVLLGDLDTMFGIASDQQAGHVDDFVRYIHPADQPAMWTAVAEARESGREYRTSFRVVRNDGMIRWVTARGRFQYAANGAPERVLGIAMDITERHEMEEQLRESQDRLAGFSQRLLEAHETERARIARELHDDISQRMAVMTMDLDGLMHLLPLSTADLRLRIATLSNRAIDLAKDVQAISHRLHSSKLDHLGLALAAAAFCNELCQHHGIDIQFSAGVIPENLSKDVALCLFRVLQEAVNNAVRHGQPHRVTVGLSASDADVRLDIVDDGIGFDPDLAMEGPGLGLISMHERLGLIGGALRIESRPGAGTAIRARAPLRNPDAH
jgi:PAS domain S-box-containing protein